MWIYILKGFIYLFLLQSCDTKELISNYLSVACGLNECSQVCSPRGLGYACECREGYQLGEDGRSCFKIHLELIRSCAIGNGGCSHICKEREMSNTLDYHPFFSKRNLFHSDYSDTNSSPQATCLCRLGYELDIDGVSCRDVDECLFKSCCQQRCENVKGSFTCSCRPGFTLQDDGCSCLEENFMPRDNMVEIIEESDLPFELQNYVDHSTLPFAKIRREKPEPKLPNLSCQNEVECRNKSQPCGPGTTGPNCLTLCRNGFYGIDCAQPCDCPKNSVCDMVTGECTCRRDRYGPNCDKPCPSKCPGRQCHRTYGYCECPAGFFGAACNLPCPDFSWGRNCLNLCRCSERDAYNCNAATGDCYCRDGSTAHKCHLERQIRIRKKKCEVGFFGLKCSEICDCDWVFSSGCHPKSGKCFCKDGFRGIRCDRECSRGFYGHKCRQQCSCSGDENCDHVTGTCASYIDDVVRTKRRCPRNTFGPECGQACDCVNHAPCSPLTGCCRCLAGFYGRKCELECPEGWHGPYCLTKCNCPPRVKCVPTDGTCVHPNDVANS